MGLLAGEQLVVYVLRTRLRKTMTSYYRLIAARIACPLGLLAATVCAMSQTPSTAAISAGAKSLDEGLFVTNLTANEAAGKKQKHHDHDDSPWSASARNRVPWFFSIGPYFSDKSVGFVDSAGNAFSESGQVGVEVALGVRYAFEMGEVRLVTRGSVNNWNISNGGGSFTVSTSDVELDALFRAQGFYIGPGLDILTATASSGGFTATSNTVAAVSGTIGYDFTSRLFVEAHWHESGTPALSGGSLSVGYRF